MPGKARTLNVASDSENSNPTHTDHIDVIHSTISIRPVKMRGRFFIEIAGCIRSCCTLAWLMAHGSVLISKNEFL